MKKTFLKTIGTAALAVLTLTIFTQILAHSQKSSAQEQSAQFIKAELSAPSDGARSLEGTWDALATFRNCRTGAALSPAFQSMNSYAQGGTMHEFGVASGLFRSPGYGVWGYTGGVNFRGSFQFFRFNTDGTYAEKVIVRKQIDLIQDNVYNATSSIEFYDPNGTLLRRGCASETATRFQ